jgi:alkaline phosphatase
VLVCLAGDFTPAGTSGAIANLPFRGLDSSYSNRVCENSTTVRDPVTNLPVGVKTNSKFCTPFTPQELNQIPNITTNVMQALNFLAKDNDGFFMMYEQGDIDWAAHGNHMDDMLGTMFDIDDTVGEIIKWVGANGGWSKNALYVTADHDHYLTLLPDFPERLAKLIVAGKSNEITPLNNSNSNPQDLAVQAGRYQDNLTQIEDLKSFSTWSDLDIATVGHFWGPRGSGGNGWGSHTTRPVPLFYQGDDACIEQMTGKPYQVLGRTVAGVPGKIDQTHLHACMLRNLFGLPAPTCTPSYAMYNAKYDMWYSRVAAASTISTPPCAVNIEARFCSPVSGPVTIQLLDSNGVVKNTRNEASAPYFLFGDSGADILAGAIAPGTYSIRTIVNGTTSASTSFTMGACFD